MYTAGEAHEVVRTNAYFADSDMLKKLCIETSFLRYAFVLTFLHCPQLSKRRSLKRSERVNILRIIKKIFFAHFSPQHPVCPL